MVLLSAVGALGERAQGAKRGGAKKRGKGSGEGGWRVCVCVCGRRGGGGRRKRGERGEWA